MEPSEEKKVNHDVAMASMRQKWPEETEATCKRFLQGSCWNVNAACESLQAYRDFRLELGDTRIEDIEEELRMGAFYFHGVTKDSQSPIVVVKVGKFAPSKTTVERVIKLNVWVMDQVWRYNKTYERCTLLVDCSGMGLRTLSFDMLKAVAHMYNTYYPEVLHHEFIINAPWIFQRLWGMMQGFLFESTRKKIHILGKEHKTFLLDYIHDENLQKQYGGASEWQHSHASAVTSANPCVGVISDRSL